MCSGNANSISRIKHRSLGIANFFNNFSCHFFTHFFRQFFSFFSIASLILRNGMDIFIFISPTISSSLIVSPVKTNQFIFFHICSLYIEWNVQPTWSWSSTFCQVQCLLQTETNSHRVNDHLRILCHTRNSLTDIKFLISHSPNIHT